MRVGEKHAEIVAFGSAVRYNGRGKFVTGERMETRRFNCRASGNKQASPAMRSRRYAPSRAGCLDFCAGGGDPDCPPVSVERRYVCKPWAGTARKGGDYEPFIETYKSF